MYARILLLLGIRSWGFVLLAGVTVFLVWMSVTSGNYSVLSIYVSLLVAVYGGAVLVSVLTKRNRMAYLPVKYSFDDSKVVKETATSSQTLRWDSFARWKKVGAYYLIYQSKRSFFVIPSARIPEGRSGAFEALLGQKIVRKRSGWRRK